MTHIVRLEDIKHAVKDIDLVEAMSNAFQAYSLGNAIVPPVGELIFNDPPGDAHIKYGYIKKDRWFVIKVATGFYENASSGLPPNSGLMLIFDSRTGLPHAILLDEGYLTNLRTAAAGALAAKLLAPKHVTKIGVVGSGMQARMQLDMLKNVTPCREAIVYARDVMKARAYARDMQDIGFRIEIANSPREVAAQANLIVTATSSHSPLLYSDDIRTGTHITAMGSDTPDKHELDAGILARADIIAADSLSQCRERGEIHHAHKKGMLTGVKIVELGHVAARNETARNSDDQITIADLTGVAVQDIEICKAIMACIAPTDQ